MSNMQNVFKVPELKKRILFTFFIIAIYRLGCHIPTPGVNSVALGEFFQKSGGTLLGFFNMFSGGALMRASIFALGIMPYISASIILQLLTAVIPSLEKLSKEGQEGQKKINQYTRYGTVALGAIQSLGISIWLEQLASPSGTTVVIGPGFIFKLITVFSLTGGTVLIMWLGEMITERGIGNGISLLIFIGIVAGTPGAILSSVRLISSGEVAPLLAVFLLIFMAIVLAACVMLESAHRKVPVQYAKRVVGRKVYGGQSSHLPLKVDHSGVIAVIFASSVLMFPATMARFVKNDYMNTFANWMSPGAFLHTIIYVAMIIFFCYFYTAITFNPEDIADNMKKSGGFVPGIRPGKKTAEYINRILTRLTLVGALAVSVIAVIPTFLMKFLNVPFYYGGTSLLIIVGVALDTVRQIESHLMMRHYDGFMKKGRVKGRG